MFLIFSGTIFQSRGEEYVSLAELRVTTKLEKVTLPELSAVPVMGYTASGDQLNASALNHYKH